MGTLRVLLGTMALGVLAWQAAVVAGEFALRRRRYREALAAARRRGKPLLVVGRPGGWPRVYGGGDATVDLDPRVARDCPGTAVVADVRQLPFPDGRFGAAFCSHVLDCLPTPQDVACAWAELRRVAEEVFLCTTHPQNLFWRWVAPEIRVWVSPRQGEVSARPRPRPWRALRRRATPVA